MAEQYFSDRERGPRLRTSTEIGEAAWGGIRAQIDRRIEDGSLGYGFPDTCPDNGRTVGTSRGLLRDMMLAEIPGVNFPFPFGEPPELFSILDLLEFIHKGVGKPIQEDFHGFFGHYHLSFDVLKGQEEFRVDINRVFSRQGIIFELDSTGLVRRVAETPTEVAIERAEFATGDATLDTLLTNARRLYFAPSADEAVFAIKELWDAWERLKTVLDPSNKKQSISTLISYAGSKPEFVALIEAEALALTKVGNEFQIRHHEVGKVPLESLAQIRYLFQRLFSLLLLLLDQRRTP